MGNPFAELRATLQEIVTVSAKKCEVCGKPIAGILFNKADYRQETQLQTTTEAGLCDCLSLDGFNKEESRKPSV